MTRVRLFVYGSLRRGHEHHVELAGGAFLGAGVTAPSYRVVTVVGYPALVPGNAAVTGELYALPSALLPELDAFEGHRYRRRSVTLSDGTDAQAYFLAEAYVS